MHDPDNEGPQADESALAEQPTDMPPDRTTGSDEAVLDVGLVSEDQ